MAVCFYTQTLFSVSKLYVLLLTHTHTLIQPEPCKIIDTFVWGGVLLFVLWVEALYQTYLTERSNLGQSHGI